MLEVFDGDDEHDEHDEDEERKRARARAAWVGCAWTSSPRRQCLSGCIIGRAEAMVSEICIGCVVSRSRCFCLAWEPR